ncbi:gamma-glutamyl hydrolase [Stomoxys calcitrans]|uniref:gamma-glutamyl hydrolase n=1 Tax=Stomoxys calcitrans TaxID=35570 RepID=UPI0027E23DD4|nr:gamma-glutamyl hydrolase [Stomoxys calcitrans]XP_013099712.2 gamma-glutamyl hydrolase [Stomoxys calcitrans]
MLMMAPIMDKQHRLAVSSALVYLGLLAACTLMTMPTLAAGRLMHYKYMDVNENPAVNTDNENPTPIVGILTQEVSQFIVRKYPNSTFSSYIAASYVKFVESAGGRVVPIWIGQKRDYYEDILSKVNGVLLPGGATYFNQSDGYADAGHHIYDIAMKINEAGTYFPVWGTCLGFELMVYLAANGTEPRTYCSSSAQALPLEFVEDFQKSRMFRNASDEVINILKNYPVTANFHMYCFTRKTFADMGLDAMWNVMSLNHDWEGSEFISSIEHKRYPFYGVQFHPEKNLFEFIPNRNITHTARAIKTSQYFADFFVSEARRNRQYFQNQTEEMESLIYNYAPKYTGAIGSSFEQQYLFDEQPVLRNDGVEKSAAAWLSLIAVLLVHRLWL